MNPPGEPYDPSWPPQPRPPPAFKRYAPVSGAFADNNSTPITGPPPNLNGAQPIFPEFSATDPFIAPQHLFQQYPGSSFTSIQEQYPEFVTSFEPQHPGAFAGIGQHAPPQQQNPRDFLGLQQEQQPHNNLTSISHSPHLPPASGPYQEHLTSAYLTQDPVVHEGFIPAPGREHEDEHILFEDSYHNARLDTSSEDDSEEERILQGLEEKNDNSELDEDYSASNDELEEDPDDLLLLQEGLDDEEEAPARRGGQKAKASRGGRRGRPSARGRGGHGGTRAPLKRKTGVRGRKKGTRGPQAAADPGPEFNKLQKLANDAYTSQDYKMAIEYASQAIQMNPEIFSAYNILSEAYAGLDDEPASIENLILGAYTKREPELWWSIIHRIENIDQKKYPQYTDAFKKEWCVNCLRSIIRLDPKTYSARVRKLELESERGNVSRCVKLCQKMLRMEGHEHEYDLLKQMAMLGTSSAKQTSLHLKSIIKYFDASIAYFVKEDDDQTLDWNLLNIYLDLLDRAGNYDYALSRLKTLCRWKQGRESETYWDNEQDDREFDIEDGPRRNRVPQFQRKSEKDDYGAGLPMEIRVKMGLFRLRQKPCNYDEAMYHLNMLEPEDEGPYAYVRDYPDVFRDIADTLHATGHDRAALRFYEPLLRTRKKEFTMKSFIGLYTCYKNLNDPDNGGVIIEILKDWNASTLEDLAILAKFFEDVEMPDEARQRAETLYRNKGGWLLRKAGYRGYFDLLDHFKQIRKQARGKGDVKKVKARKYRKKVKAATGIEHDSEDEERDTAKERDAAKERRKSKPLNKRPAKGRGLYRKKDVPLAPRPPVFLPVQERREPSSIPQAPATLEGTDLSVDRIERKLFRQKLENLASDNADDLKSKRAQHREIVTSFQQLQDLHELADAGDEDATAEYLSVARELVEEFSTFDLFYAEEKRLEFKGYFRRIGGGELWKDSALMVLAVEANRVEDGEEERVLEERPSVIEKAFWGIDFDKWIEMFGRYAIYLARTQEAERCFSALDVATQSNIVFRSETYGYQLELCRLACALAVDDSLQISASVRAFLKRFPYGTDVIRLYSIANRICPVSDAYAHGAAHKAFLRYIKTVDYVMVKPEQRSIFNFQGDDSSHWLRGVISSGLVEKAQHGHDPALFALYGHVLMCSGSYKGALNYYFRAFAMTPSDPVVNLCIGISYFQHAMKRQAENRQFQIQQGISFMTRYYDLRTRDNVAVHCSEAEFNMGRMWHGLGLATQALKAYMRCIALSDRVKQEAADQCRDDAWGVEDFATEAAYAVQTIYTLSGDFEGARSVTEAALVIE